MHRRGYEYTGAMWDFSVISVIFLTSKATWLFFFFIVFYFIFLKFPPVKCLLVATTAHEMAPNKSKSFAFFCCKDLLSWMDVYAVSGTSEASL